MWFLKWWFKHGAQTEIIPDKFQVTKQVPGGPKISTYTLRESLEHFTKMYKWSEYYSNFPLVLLFVPNTMSHGLSNGITRLKRMF